MVLMAMKLLAFDNEFVPHLAPGDQQDNFLTLDIIQDAQLANPKLEFGQRIGRQTFDRFRGRCGLLL
jgi:hypothetical protein